MLKRYLLAALLLTFPVSAGAAELRAREQATIGQSERIAEDAYVFGGTVSSAGSVAGDIIVGGGTVIIDGSVSGDVMVGGGTVTVLGRVGDDLRIAGGTITISAPVSDDVVVVGGQTSLSGEGVGGDMLWAGGTLNVGGPVSGSLKLAGGEVYVNATIDGDLEFRGDKLVLGPQAVIGGDVIYTAPQKLTLEEGAVVRGETTYTKSGEKSPIGMKGLFAIISVLVLGKFLSVLACALVIGLGLRRWSSTIIAGVTKAPLLELGRGFAVFVLWPLASVALLFTVLGIPLGIAGLLGFAILVIFISLFAPVILGSLASSWMFKTDPTLVTWKSILLGTALYFIVSAIPVVGWLAVASLTLMTLGSSMKLKWEALKEWR
jgi:hypothetical protein